MPSKQGPEKWNWFKTQRGHWCEIGYSQRSVCLKFQTTNHDTHSLRVLSPEIAERIGKALIKAASLARKLHGS